jgi:hypothetical protein
MILMQLIQRPPVGEGMIQSRIGQIGFGFAMTDQQAFHHGCQQFHFGRRLGAGQHPFDLIKHFAVNRVFKNQGFGDSCHILMDCAPGRGGEAKDDDWGCALGTT